MTFRPPALGSRSLAAAPLVMVSPPLARRATRHLTRDALHARLAVVLQSAVTMVTTPTGWGKTALVADWLATTPVAATWHTVDAAPPTVMAFWHAVISALATDVPPCTDVLPALAEEAPLPTVLGRLIACWAHDARPRVLVLDDYHQLTHAAIHPSVQWFAAHLPLNVHLVILSRTPPPITWLRRDQTGTVTTLTVADLRLSVAETDALLQQYGVGLALADVQTLATATDGWLLGVHMLAEHLARQDDPAAALRPLLTAPHTLWDYLVQHVLHAQADAWQTVITHTILLDAVSPALAAAITSVPHADDILAQIHAAQLFLTVHPTDATTLCYHPLFAAAVRAHLARTDPLLRATVYQRAAQWYADAGDYANAITHAQAIPDPELVADLLVQAIWPLWARGGVLPLRDALAALPPACKDARPFLLLFEAWIALLDGRLSTARAVLHRPAAQPTRPITAWSDAAGAAFADQDPVWQHTVWWTILVTYLAVLSGDAVPLLTTLDPLLRAVPSSAGAPWHIFVLHGGMIHAKCGQMRAAHGLVTQALQMSAQVGDPTTEASARLILANVELGQGRLHTAAAHYRIVLAQAPHLLVLRGRAHVGLGSILLEWDDLVAAAEHLALGLALAEAHGPIETLLHGHLAQARVLAARDGAAAVLPLLTQFHAATLHQHRSALTPFVAAAHARIALHAGQAAAALGWLHGSGLHHADTLVSARLPLYLVFAEVLGAHGAWTDAQQVLHQVVAVADAHGWQHLHIAARVQLALVQAQSGDADVAWQSCWRALELAAAGSYVRVFAESGAIVRTLLLRPAPPDAAPLLRHYHAQVCTALGIAIPRPSLTQAVPRGADVTADPSGDQAPHDDDAAPIAPGVGNTAPPAPRDPPTAPLVVPAFTATERTILTALATHAPTAEIAAQLHRTPSTVAWHLGNIYAKLGVRSRHAAVSAARALGVLPPPRSPTRDPRTPP